MEHLSCDVLVVGSGAAGLRAAIAAREKKLDVCVISKGPPGKGTSTILSGGVFAGAREGQCQEEHREHTLLAGRGINQRELVDALVEEAPSRLQELLDWGVRAVVHQGHLIAKERPLIWGEGVVRCLLTKAQGLGVRLMGGLGVWRVILEQGASRILAYSTMRNEWRSLSARALILATGGAGALYLIHDNPQRMTGDGYALALQAGAILQDMEFVQFYPVGLAEKGFPPLLIPGQLADLGGLFNGRGEDITEKYRIREGFAIQRARDRVAQAMFQEIFREGEAVWLDLRGVSEERWREDPYLAFTWEILGERCGAKYRPLRVRPLAHHVMGGVHVDAWGATSVPGLFAAGEVTGGLHGANRLGGNGLTETVVFGARAGASAASWALGSCAGDGGKPSGEDLRAFLPESRKDTSGMIAVDLKKRLRGILWEDGGILRNRQGLTRSLAALKEIEDEAQRLSPERGSKGMERLLDLRLGTTTASLILHAALKREESRGAHFREDFPEQDNDHWQGHLQVHRLAEGREEWSFEPVAGADSRCRNDE